MDESRINNFQRRQLTSHMLRKLNISRFNHRLIGNNFVYNVALGGESLPERLGPSSTQLKAPVINRVGTARQSR
jgi:hypothetical protein